MKKVVVVIPVYTETLSPFEQVSLAQVQKVLARYDICFMAPERMRSFFTAKGLTAEYWPDTCFADVHGYSKLLLTPEFYERFSAYEYLLIYQLDAFVFSDQLNAFCDLNYDYIGAPLPYWSGWPYRMHLVGNGGFSLRKISSCIRVTRDREVVYKKTQAQYIMELMEDRFFAYCGWDKSIDFTTPMPKVAEMFSMEFDVNHCYRKLAKGKLPFGCHGWTKPMYFDRWEKYIRTAGYDLDEEVSRAVRRIGWKARRKAYAIGICHALVVRMFRHHDRHVLEQVARKVSWLDGTILWGNGIRGKKMQYWLNSLGIRIAGVFDQGATKGTMVAYSHSVTKPDDDIIRSKKYKIIVTPKTCYDDISADLRTKGLEENVDFYSYCTIEWILAAAYYNGTMN